MAQTENIFIKYESFYVSRHAYLKKREGMAIMPLLCMADLWLEKPFAKSANSKYLYESYNAFLNILS